MIETFHKYKCTITSYNVPSPLVSTTVGAIKSAINKNEIYSHASIWYWLQLYHAITHGNPR